LLAILVISQEKFVGYQSLAEDGQGRGPGYLHSRYCYDDRFSLWFWVLRAWEAREVPLKLPVI